MNKRALKTILRNSLVPFVLLAFFLLGFYALERFSPFGLTDGETVTLDQAPSGEGSGADGFQIEQVIKRNVGYPVYNLMPVDRDRFVFTDNQTNLSLLSKRLAEDEQSTTPEWMSIERARIGVMNVNDDHTTFLNTNIIPESVALSPDRSLLLYSAFGHESSKLETLVLKLASGETLQRFDTESFANLFIDQDTIMGFTADTFTIQDISNANPVVSMSSLKVDGKWWRSLKSAGTPNQFYLMTQSTDGSEEIYRYNLRRQNKTRTSKIMEGDNINDFIPLNERMLLYLSSRNETEGIYAFDWTNHQHVLLRKGVMSSFDVAPSNNKVAYALQNGSGVWELHAAWLRDGKLEGDRLIYGGLRNLDSVKWSPDGDAIFCVSINMEGSILYRFILK
ncbi:hypothetical protein ACFQ3W_08760 [Paenibacillus puldeungensis]|uniref:WD40 repeat domain-containing protein n=1 Tax=Paenibacillus puldeungensis TaxID=696536 RepID=A0ABW3RV68_9BACL